MDHMSGLDNISLDDVVETFDLLDDWEDRYRYVIDLGRKLPPLPEEAYQDRNKVRGCASQVWMILEPGADGRIHILADSDAHIVKGLIAILLLIFRGKTRAQILATDAREILTGLGLADHLSPMRTNGLFSMVQRIGELAAVT